MFSSPLNIVWNDPKLLGDSGEVPISVWSGWGFDSRREIFSLFDGKKTSYVGRKPRAHPLQGWQ